MPGPFADPPAGRGADYVEWLAGLQWNAEQLAVLRRAESLRALGRLREAADLVALQCEWPPRVTVREYALVSSLDLRRWFAAFTGRSWDGIPASMRSARDAATRRRRGQAPAAGTRVPTAGGVYKQYCTSHLLVEPLDNNPHAEQLADYTLDVGWPSYFDAGSLNWQDPDAPACVYCDALLLPSEVQPIRGADSWVVCGRSCCAQGCVLPCCRSILLSCHIDCICVRRQIDLPPEPEQPLWLRNLWLGWPGRTYGEEGMMRSAARHYSRQLHNGLSLSSQAHKERQFSGWAPSVVIEGRVSRKMGSLMPDADPSDAPNGYLGMYVHDAMYGHSENGVLEEPSIPSSRQGHRIVLPARTSAPDRHRVLALFDQLFAYVKSVNEYVRQCCTIAEEMENSPPSLFEHCVLMLKGKRTRAQQAADQSRSSPFAVQASGSRSPFASAAGSHGRIGGLQEMCVLCPRTAADNEECKIIVNLRRGGLTYIPIQHRSFDSLYHVLLNPTGRDGWEDQLERRSLLQAFLTLPAAAQLDRSRVRSSSALNPRSSVSMLEYYGYRCHWRRGHLRTDNCKFMTDRLFQEYACVAFWRVEQCRIQWHRMDQQDKRLARVDELHNYASQMSLGNTPADIGRISYLPPSFVGGPSDNYAKYQDAMTGVLYHGAPSLFATMTANPRWPEVLRSLAYGQSQNERYDVIARVFRAKLDELLKDLEAKLGKQICRVYVIEFQKRGLPHAHIVVILNPVDRPRGAQDIDAMSSAEIPPLPAADDTSEAARAQRKLRDLVLEHMVHNDCSGTRGCTCPCWDATKKRCAGNFPFAYQDASTIGDERQKAKLRRRQGDMWTADTNGRRVTNQWVVPYNAALLMKFQCHLNIEIVTASYAIKYLFKYLFKGGDSASAAVHATSRILDKISHYEEKRYLGSSEAFWRLFKFPMHDMTNTVVRMVVQLPEER